ncbi:hypothetical protein ASG17_07560 [Brevundimonas sp. Leaf363]|uniref:phage tail length tape measure family protein n=1 Tax=Brevundimonas sp. Leaf363 TaxID=1736353 RepID=UPI00070172C7|nr:phage tail length tape measure family protein [Brevundimonas sp. Leaf363]KQS55898.1 hypothetical protein ASG17_07560 [Brevundimonas sp. Leaf363]
MTDIARLAVVVESQQAELAEDRLDGLSASADRAEASVDGLAAAARGTSGPLQAMNAGIMQQQRALASVQRGMGLTAQEGLNFSRQMSDVFVQAAMGTNPLMIAIMQGPQLFDIFQTAAIRAGTGIRAAMIATGAVVWTALAPLLPIIAALAAGAAVVAGAWGLATRSLSSDIGDVTDGMGLTREQMERLKEEGVSSTATAGDAFKALGTTIKEMFVETFGEQLDWVGERWNEFLDLAGKVAINAAGAIGAAFIGTYNVIRNNWRAIPAVLGDAAISAANITIRAVEGMVNAGIAGINRLIAGAKGLAAVNPAFSLAGSIGYVDEVRFSGIGNPFAGAAANLIGRAGSEYITAFDQTLAGLTAAYERWMANTEATARARNRAAAGDARATRGGRDRPDALATQRLTDFDVPNLRPLDYRLPELIDPLKLLADEMRLINGLADDMARGLSSAFGEPGRALGDLLTTMTSYEARLADIDLAQKEHRLSSVQADRERAQAQMQNYGDMAAAARGFFEEGSDGYRVLLAIEQVYRAQQLAGMLMAMTTGQTETASAVAGSLARGASYMVEGAAKMFAALGPFAFPLVAAMVAVLASLGLRGSSGGGSASYASNDNMPGGSATTGIRTASQGYQAQQEAARRREPVEVMVTADRDGLNAYVMRTASDVATPMSAAAYEGSVTVSRSTVPVDQSRRAARTLKTGRRA